MERTTGVMASRGSSALPGALGMGALLLMGCSSPAAAPETSTAGSVARVDEEVVLGVGDAVLVQPDGVRVTFDGVTEDSRCPVDVTCVWAGVAVLRMLVDEPDAPVRTETLRTDSSGSGIVIGDRVLRLVRLTPEAHSEHPIPADAYEATLRLGRRP